MPPTFRPRPRSSTRRSSPACHGDHHLWTGASQSAVTADIGAMMKALPALARVARYGDVRGTAAADVMPVIDALFQRVIVGLPGAVSSLDDSAAEAIVQSMGEVTASVGLLDNPDMRADWQLIMRRLADLEGCHGLVRGSACRLLVAAVFDEAELRRRARLALSPACRRGGGLVQGRCAAAAGAAASRRLVGRARRMARGVPADLFTELLPLSGAPSPVPAAGRRAMSEKAKHRAASAARRGPAPTGGCRPVRQARRPRAADPRADPREFASCRLSRWTARSPTPAPKKSGCIAGASSWASRPRRAWAWA
jgi:hypothetical protein